MLQCWQRQIKAMSLPPSREAHCWCQAGSGCGSAVTVNSQCPVRPGRSDSEGKVHKSV